MTEEPLSLPVRKRRKLQKAKTVRKIVRTYPFGYWVYTYFEKYQREDEWITGIWFFTRKGAEKYANRET